MIFEIVCETVCEVMCVVCGVVCESEQTSSSSVPQEKSSCPEALESMTHTASGYSPLGGWQSAASHSSSQDHDGSEDKMLGQAGT